jgi:hypothetical protein
MKNIFLITTILVLSLTANAQKGKVDWKFSSKKISEGNYELTMVATVPTGWHLYSQFTGEGPVATAFTFNKNALVTLNGKVKETGKLVTLKDKIFNNTQKYFSGVTTFTQKVKIKTKIKTNVSGEVEYMICDDKTCMPPTTQKFNISL